MNGWCMYCGRQLPDGNCLCKAQLTEQEERDLTDDIAAECPRDDDDTGLVEHS